MTDQRWLKVELRKSYVTPTGISEETQTLSREDTTTEYRERIRQKRAEVEEQAKGMNAHQRRELLESLPDPDTYEIENFEAIVLDAAQKYAARPVVEEIGDRLAYVYPSAQVLRVAVDVLEVADGKEEPSSIVEAT